MLFIINKISLINSIGLSQLSFPMKLIIKVKMSIINILLLINSPFQLSLSAIPIII